MSPLWASEVMSSGMPMPRSLSPVRELAPMHFGFGEGAADSEDHAFAIVTPNAVGDEGGAISHCAVDADFVISGVEGHVCHLG